MALIGLPLMWCSAARHFAFRRRQAVGGGTALEGTSIRYGAIVLLGAQYVDAAAQRRLLSGETASEFCSRLIHDVPALTTMGDAALVAWAAADLRHSELPRALEILEQQLSSAKGWSTVDTAWALSAMVAAREQANIGARAHMLQNRLLEAQSVGGSGIFRHVIDPADSPWYRSHVGCFADQVYPIQALARHHRAFGDHRSLAAAELCAQRIVRLQGPAGQWWWHYDARNGGVIEGYPVYSVHQDAMAPMALLDLADAGGTDYSAAIRAGLSWLAQAPEIGRSLIDEDLNVIWRKVGRSDPRKATRAIRALSTRIHRSVKFGMLDKIWRAASVDYECRPYHLGWILHAWLGGMR